MSSMTTVDLKAFVPSNDFELCKQFYRDLGFTVVWSNDDGLACISHGRTAFLLQKFFIEPTAQTLIMHLLVESVESWWAAAEPVLARYGIRAEPPENRPWGIRDFAFLDPSGVAWRIGQSTE